MAGRGINKVILVGNLGSDPEVRHTPNGVAVANVSVATSDFWKDKNTGERQERTEWHRVVFFNRLAEVVEQYLSKGSKVYVEGSLQTRSWEQDGVKRYSTEIVARDMQMLDSRGGGDGPMPSGPRSQPGPEAYGQQGQPGQKQQEGQKGQAAPPATDPAGNFDGLDDDIPF